MTHIKLSEAAKEKIADEMTLAVNHATTPRDAYFRILAIIERAEVTLVED